MRWAEALSRRDQGCASVRYPSLLGLCVQANPGLRN
jgi:hypothetical protein